MVPICKFCSLTINSFLRKGKAISDAAAAARRIFGNYYNTTNKFLFPGKLIVRGVEKLTGNFKIILFIN